MVDRSMYESVIPEPSAREQDRRELKEVSESGDSQERLCCWHPPRSRASVRESPRFSGADITVTEMSGRESLSVASPENGCSRRFEFVRTNWFIGLSGFVLLSNIVTILLELVYPESGVHWWYFDQFYLIFYVLELMCRVLHFQGNLLFDCNTNDVWYNWLDFALVVTSVYDQWVVPVMAEESHSRQGGFSTWIRALRVLRFLRVLRLVRVLLEADTSWAEGARFQTFIACIILSNAVMMGVETDYKWHGWFYFEQLILFIFFFELCVQIKHLGLLTFLCGEGLMWNWLDFTIVCSGIIDQWILPLVDLLSADMDGGVKINLVAKFMMLMRLMRLLRILRLLRLVKTVRPLYTLALGVLAAMQGMFWVLVLTSMTLYAFAILATKLIGHGMLFSLLDDDSQKHEAATIEAVRDMFGTVSGSMFVLFQVMNGKEDEMEPLFSVIPYMKVIFVIFMVVTSWALLSILTAVLSENMIVVTQRQDKESRAFEETAKIQDSRNKLELLFKELDKDGSDALDEEEFNSLLENQSGELVKLARLSETEIQEVFEYLSVSGEVRSHDFVEGLLSLSSSIENHQPVSERSVMRLERRLRGLTNDVTEIKDLLQFQALQKVVRKTHGSQGDQESNPNVNLRRKFKEFRRSRAALRKSTSSGRLEETLSSTEIALGNSPRVADANCILKPRSSTKRKTGASIASIPEEDENFPSTMYQNTGEDKHTEQASPSAQPSAMGQPQAIPNVPTALIDLEASAPAVTDPESSWGPSCCAAQSKPNLQTIDAS